MSASTVSDFLEVSAPTRFWDRARRLGAGLIVVGLIATIVFGALATSETARFLLTAEPNGPALSISGQTGAIVFGVLTLVAGGALLTGRLHGRWQAALLVAGIVAFV